jgi:EXLDI family protein
MGVMPNKTIYVSDDDLPLYDRAQELAGGNLSAAVARALRRFVEVEERGRDGYREVTVRVGSGRARRAQRFVGMLLGEWRHRMSDRRMERFRVYRTPKGNFALHITKMPDWAAWSSPEAWIGELADWAGTRFVQAKQAGAPGCWWGPLEETLAVAQSLDDLGDKIPAEFYETLVAEAGRPAVEELDI